MKKVRLGMILSTALVAVTLLGSYIAAPSAMVNAATETLTWATTGNNINKKAFLGSTNNQPLVFKTNNTEKMRITQNGNVGVGTNLPAAALEMAKGRLRLSDPTGFGDVEFTEAADLIAHTTSQNPSPSDPAFRVDTGKNLTRVLTVLNNGNVGIGTGSPLNTLDVKGRLHVQSPAGKTTLLVDTDGEVGIGALAPSTTNHICYAGAFVFASCSSAAEYVPSIDGGKGFPETADLVSIAPAVKNPYGDAHGPFTVQKSATACDTNLLGYIVKPESGADGVKLNDHYLPLAIYGYFPAKVTVANGAIQRGDPITSSGKAGYGMKATGACKVIGYALEDANADGTIQVFANYGDNSAAQVADLQQENRALRHEVTSLATRLLALEQSVTPNGIAAVTER